MSIELRVLEHLPLLELGQVDLFERSPTVDEEKLQTVGIDQPRSFIDLPVGQLGEGAVV